MISFNSVRVFAIIREHAENRNVSIFQTWASRIQCNPAGQLCPDAQDIADLVSKLGRAERARVKAEMALDKFFMVEAEAKAEAARIKGAQV